MDATTITVTPFGSAQPVTLDLAAIYHEFQQIPDHRHRRGVRYLLAVLLTIAVLLIIHSRSSLAPVSKAGLPKGRSSNL